MHVLPLALARGGTQWPPNMGLFALVFVTYSFLLKGFLRLQELWSNNNNAVAANYYYVHDNDVDLFIIGVKGFNCIWYPTTKNKVPDLVSTVSIFQHAEMTQMDGADLEQKSVGSNMVKKVIKKNLDNLKI